jgi:hypothetical protein
MAPAEGKQRHSPLAARVSTPNGGGVVRKAKSSAAGVTWGVKCGVNRYINRVFDDRITLEVNETSDLLVQRNIPECHNIVRASCGG